MKKQLSVLNKLRISSLLRIMILSIVILTSSVGLYSLNTIRKIQLISTDVYQLKSDILMANLAIRNAAIAHTPKDINFELEKTLVTRTSATRIYERLDSAALTEPERRTFLEMKADRSVYREAQNKVVDKIKKDDDDGFWEALPSYQIQLDLYLKRTDSLIQSVGVRICSEYDRLLSLMLSALVFGLIWVTYALCRVLR